jgi:hypothetical protein
MDPQLQALGVQLADTAVRNTAGSIADRITAARARRQDKETIAELEEIISALLSDKNELVQIAQAFEQELVGQRIAENDITYISSNVVPLLRRFAEQAGDPAGSAREAIDAIEKLLTPEFVTVMQLLGFNFRRAVGEPLTGLVAALISSRTPLSPEADLELQRVTLEREIAYLDLARDPDATSRLRGLLGQE